MREDDDELPRAFPSVHFMYFTQNLKPGGSKGLSAVILQLQVAQDCIGTQGHPGCFMSNKS
jgi:hypothetical protein